MSKEKSISFSQFLYQIMNGPSLHNEDIVHLFVPLLQQVKAIHDKGLVIPIQNFHNIHYKNGILEWVNIYGISTKIQSQALKNWQQYFNQTLIIEEVQIVSTVIGSNLYQIDQQATTLHASQSKIPQYLPNYNAYELVAEQHDQLTDIFCLGQIMASIMLQLDLNDIDDWYEFKQSIHAPVHANAQLHPQLGHLLSKMTALDRSARIQSMEEVIYLLEHYNALQDIKESNSDIEKANIIPLSATHVILQSLKSKLFDTSKRNRLLYFKPNARAVNLSIGSIPHVLKYEHIRVGDLFLMNEQLLQLLKKGKSLLLNQWLKWQDHAYLPALLDKLRLEDQKNQQEFGFSQLNWVPLFLNWYDYKEDKNTPIQTPLLLVPVRLKKTKALVNDQYAIEFNNLEAEVNPVLAHVLWENYQLKLPKTVALTTEGIQQFITYFSQIIQQSNNGVALQYLDKPRLQLMHSLAQKSRQLYNKIKIRHRIAANESALSFPLTKASDQLMGIQLFNQYVQAQPIALEYAVHASDSKSDKGPSFYELSGSNHNPFVWEIDACNMVIGNFNAQKMRLVEDYDYLLETNTTYEVIDQLFLQSKSGDFIAKDQAWSLNNCFPVIAADPSQFAALQAAQSGKSFVIQGPPGTGKSQTITNIIADGIAHGKKILFVCEKRAALDVVYARLKQQQLHHWCSYIHDSQADKKSFILDLKAHYEYQLQHPLDWPAIDRERSSLLVHLENAMQQLQDFHEVHQSIPSYANCTVSTLINKLLANQSAYPLQYDQLLPSLKDWDVHAGILQQLQEALAEEMSNANFAAHPFSQINSIGMQKLQDTTLFTKLLQSTSDCLLKINTLIYKFNLNTFTKEQLAVLQVLVQAAQPLALFGQQQKWDLLYKESLFAIDFKGKLNYLDNIKQKFELQLDRNKNWIEKWDEVNANAALRICQKYEQHFFKFLFPSWRTTKKQLQLHYNIDNHVVKPLWSEVLVALLEEIKLQQSLAVAHVDFNKQFDLPGLNQSIDSIINLQNSTDPSIVYILQHPAAQELVSQLIAEEPVIAQLNIQLRQLLDNYETITISALQDTVDTIMLNLAHLPRLQPILLRIAAMPANIQQALKLIPLPVDMIKEAVLQKTYQKLKTSSPNFAKLQWEQLQAIVQQIEQTYNYYLQMNGLWMQAYSNKILHDHIQLSSLANNKLNDAQIAFKKNYQEGRKILEHEFNKSMRFKSIRSLNTSESQLVIQDLKPVWLMSPLSVADILPLDKQQFDMVIFDEASQITLEDGIPAAFRGPQVIIVGDEKQMPPTVFFKSQNQEDAMDASVSNPDLLVHVDSLLVQGNKKLPHMLLSWHYRSRYEPLINFSNYAFYQSQLLTIPDIKNHAAVKQLPPITAASQARDMLPYIFDRSISYHYLPFAQYEQRSNLAEAEYIAHLLYQLLINDHPATIGIVAFSMEQQACIENAIEHIAAQDAPFATALEKAYSRTENEQFVGLIIKNLEQIQGDERDIIIMSIGYGYNQDNKMKMHFGPINQKGGEKRLNVLFSRAKQHMVVVAGIQYDAIKNTNNDGARYFRHFLQYAAAISEGNLALAYQVLRQMQLNNTPDTVIENNSIVITQVIDFLILNNYYIDKNIGAANFKCPIGVKLTPTDENYILGIFIDNDYHYSAKQAIEPYYIKQQILKAFGWKSILMPAKMWLEQRELMEAIILEAIRSDMPINKLTDANVNKIHKYIDKQQNKQFQTAKLTHAALAESLDWQYFEWTDPASHIVYFWQIAMNDLQLVTRAGKLGNTGQTKIQRFKNKADVLAAIGQLVDAQKQAGYISKDKE